jgi:hypothetical protein
MRKKQLVISAVLLSGIVLLLLAAGCSSTTGAAPVSGSPSPEQAAFIAAANNCTNMNLTDNEDIGTFYLTSSQGCVFTKTLVHLNDSEMQGMKTMLEGTNLTCSYTQGNFDSRWVTSLVGGIEYCNGDLKDAIAKLTIFTT